MVVKHIAKYITLLLAIILTAVGYANDSETSAVETPQQEAATMLCETFVEAPMQGGEISISHQVSAPHTIQLQGTAKRTNNAHKNNHEFIAAGRALNTRIANHIFKKPSTINTSFTKSEHRLIRLGRLII